MYQKYPDIHIYHSTEYMAQSFIILIPNFIFILCYCQGIFVIMYSSNGINLHKMLDCNIIACEKWL